MKKMFLALVLAFASASAFASQGTASVSAEVASDYLYRGQSVTGDRPAVTAGLHLQDLVVKGTFVNLTGTTIDLTDLDRDGALRTELEVGFGHKVGRLDTSLSVARVLNPVLYSADYTEARLGAEFELTKNLAVTGQYAQILNSDVGDDRYASLGLKYSNFLVDGLTVGGLVSAQDYKSADRTEFNNAELFATYALSKNVEVFGLYSWGGKSVLSLTDRADVNFHASDLSDQGAVGLRVKF